MAGMYMALKRTFNYDDDERSEVWQKSEAKPFRCKEIRVELGKVSILIKHFLFVT